VSILCQRLYFLVCEPVKRQTYQELTNPKEAVEQVLFRRLGYKNAVQNIQHEENILTFSLLVDSNNISYCNYVLNGNLNLEELLQELTYAKNH